jgi:DNA-binding NarL/FixJ family response regulator
VTIRCVIVDDDPQFIEAARRLLDGENGVHIVGAAGNSAQALQRVTELRPDLVLVDVRLGEESGIALAHRIAEDVNAPWVILVSSYSADDLATVLPEPAQIGFLSKVELSADAIRCVLS